MRLVAVVVLSGCLGFEGDPNSANPDAAIEPDADPSTLVRSWGTPVPLSEVNQPNTIEVHPTMSVDQKMLCFARGASSSRDIFCATRSLTTVPFSQPVFQSLSQQGSVEQHPAFSPDGTRLYFATDRVDGSEDIHYAVLENGEFVGAVPVTELNASTNATSPYETRDGSAIFLATRDNASFDIAVSLRESPGPVRIEALSSAELDSDPAVNADGSLMLLCSQRETVPFFAAFIAERSGPDVLDWGTPERLQLPNLPPGQACSAEITSDGSLLFHFCPDSTGDCDIYIAPPA